MYEKKQHHPEMNNHYKEEDIQCEQGKSLSSVYQELLNNVDKLAKTQSMSRSLLEKFTREYNAPEEKEAGYSGIDEPKIVEMFYQISLSLSRLTDKIDVDIRRVDHLVG